MLCVPTCGLIAGALDRELVGSELPERFEQPERCDSPGVRDPIEFSTSAASTSTGSV